MLASVAMWLAGIVAGVICTVLLQDSLYYALARCFGGRFRRGRGLRGRWNTVYRYQTSGQWKTDDPSFEVRLFGKYVVAAGTSSQDGSTYKVRGKLTDEGLITGQWSESTGDGRQYYGAFQLLVLRTNTEMEGLWIGFSRQDNIRSGKWHWTKEGSAQPSAALDKK